VTYSTHNLHCACLAKSKHAIIANYHNAKSSHYYISTYYISLLVTVVQFLPNCSDITLTLLILLKLSYYINYGTISRKRLNDKVLK